MIFTRKQYDKAFMENMQALKLLNPEFIDVDSDTDYNEAANKAWYIGETNILLKFYKTIPYPAFDGVYHVRNFYEKVNSRGTFEKTVYHYNLSNTITQTMASLLFNKCPDVSISTGNINEDEKLNDILQNIFYENDFQNLLQKAAELESYSGAVAFKIVIDNDFSNLPIIIPYPKEDVIINKKYGRINEIVFKDTYTKNDINYTLYSIYGRGYINYKLYKKDEEVKLTELDETKTLNDIKIVDSDGKPLQRILSVYKENKSNSRSDYDGAIDEFCSIDELYTNMIDLIEKAYVIEYIPENMLEKDLHTDKTIIPNTYDRNIVPLYDSNTKDKNVTQKAERDYVDVSNTLNSYKEVLNNLILNCLTTVGLSPATCGYDISGANSSALALSIREKTSIRTRNTKMLLWETALKDLTEVLLDFYFIKQINKTELLVDDFNNDVYVKFAEYEGFQRFDELVNTLGNAKDKGLIDLDKAMEILNNEFYHVSDEDLEIMKMNINGELNDSEDIEEKELNKEEPEETDMDDQIASEEVEEDKINE